MPKPAGPNSNKENKHNLQLKPLKIENNKLENTHVTEDDAEVSGAGNAPTEININHVLPTELLFKIFGLLSFCILKNVVLVCARWRHIGEDPQLWKNFKLNVNIDLLDARMILTTKRFQSLQFLNLHYHDGKKLNDVLQVVIDQSDIKHLTMKCLCRYVESSSNVITVETLDLKSMFSLNEVNASLLAKLFAKMKTLNIGDCSVLDTEHVKAIFTEMYKSTNLVKLDVNFNVDGNSCQMHKQYSGSQFM